MEVGAIHKNKRLFTINAEGGYAGLKRKGDLEYTEERSANGEQFENGEFKSLDDFDIHETFGLGESGRGS